MKAKQRNQKSELNLWEWNWNEWKVAQSKKEFCRQRCGNEKKSSPLLCLYMHEEKKDCERKRRVPFAIDTLEHFIFYRMRNKESISMSVHGRCVYPIWTIDKIQSIFLHTTLAAMPFTSSLQRRRKKRWKKPRWEKLGFSFTLVFLYGANSSECGKGEKAHNLMAKRWVLKYSFSLAHTTWIETVERSINTADSKKKKCTQYGIYLHLQQIVERKKPYVCNLSANDETFNIVHLVFTLLFHSSVMEMPKKPDPLPTQRKKSKKRKNKHDEQPTAWIYFRLPFLMRPCVKATIVWGFNKGSLKSARLIIFGCFSRAFVSFISWGTCRKQNSFF